MKAFFSETNQNEGHYHREFLYQLILLIPDWLLIDIVT